MSRQRTCERGLGHAANDKGVSKWDVETCEHEADHESTDLDEVLLVGHHDDFLQPSDLGPPRLFPDLFQQSVSNSIKCIGA
jgi:hypothetical protein